MEQNISLLLPVKIKSLPKLQLLQQFYRKWDWYPGTHNSFNFPVRRNTKLQLLQLFYSKWDWFPGTLNSYCLPVQINTKLQLLQETGLVPRDTLFISFTSLYIYTPSICLDLYHYEMRNRAFLLFEYVQQLSLILCCLLII